MKIAIDGPAGAGKSTIAKLVAQKLNYIFVDTGAMYRALGLYLLRAGVNPDDEEACAKELPNISVTIDYIDHAQHVFLNGEDVTEEIRNARVGDAASKTSAYPKVRAHLLSLQRDFAKTHSVVMDGRDIGTVVLPDAEVKIFLTASFRIRAIRRLAEMEERGILMTMEEVEQAMKERDYRDTHRTEAPLKPAEDAVLIDSSDFSIPEVVDKILTIVAGKK